MAAAVLSADGAAKAQRAGSPSAADDSALLNSSEPENEPENGRKTGQGGKRDRSNYCGIAVPWSAGPENGTAGKRDSRKTGLVQLLWDCGGVVCSAAEGHAAFEDSDRGMRLMGGCGVSQPAIRIAGAGWIGRIDDHN